MLDESRYQELTHAAFRRLETAFVDVDPDLVEAYFEGDVLTLAFTGGSRCVINTQRPTRQIWVAAQSKGYHFDWDPQSQSWRDDRGGSVELFTLIERIVRETAGIDVKIRSTAETR